MPYAYILECADGSYYVGSTVDLDRRLWEHNHSDELGPRYTRTRRPVALAWSQEFDRIDGAFAFEKQVQGWNRVKREALISGDREALPSLSRRRGGRSRDTTPGG